MPWSVSESPLGRRLPVTSANAMGGYNRAMTPNPNSAMSTFKRNNTGQAITPVNTALLGEAANQTDAADTAQHDAYLAGEAQKGRIDTTGSGQMDRMNKSMQSASPWRLMLQSLKNAGAGGVQTGAAAGMQEPGFYDNQAPSIAGFMTAAQMNRRNNVASTMANYNTGAYQDSRRS